MSMTLNSGLVCRLCTIARRIRRGPHIYATRRSLFGVAPMTRSKFALTLKSSCQVVVSRRGHDGRVSDADVRCQESGCRARG